MTALLNDPQWSTFLAAIRANLADDTVRLVAADFLDENAGSVSCGECEGRGRGDKFMRATDWFRGKTGPSTIATDCPKCSGSGRVSNGFAEYAEFVRVQVEIARISPGTSCVQCGRKSLERPNVKYCGDGSNKDYSHRYEASEEMKSLRDRQEEIYDGNALGWFYTDGIDMIRLDRYADGAMSPTQAIIRRGFIDEIRCPMATWLEHGQKIVRLPTAAVRKVVVTDRSADIDQRQSHDENGVRYHCRWFKNSGQQIGSGYHWTEQQSVLPDEIHETMTANIISGQAKEWPWWFRTNDNANAAISDACLAWAWASEPAVNV